MNPTDDRDVSKKASPEDEEAAARHFVETLVPRIDAFQDHWEHGDRTVLPGSSLHRDDEHSQPFQISHAVWHSIGYAMDHLHGVRRLTLEGTHPDFRLVTHPYAVYPMIRSALENASTALWMLGPASRDARLIRRFRSILTDSGNRDTVITLTGAGEGGQRDERLNKIRPLAERRGLDEGAYTRWVGNKEIIRGGATFVDFEPDHAEAMWRMLSGLAHGDLWASMTFTDREQITVSADGEVFTVRATSSISNVSNMTAVAVAATSCAVRLYEQRRLAPFGP